VIEDLEQRELDQKVLVKDVGKMALKGVQYSVPTFSVLGLEKKQN